MVCLVLIILNYIKLITFNCWRYEYYLYLCNG
nr:MAG TPA: hypothetical protein [Crassvirales sp.]